MIITKYSISSKKLIELLNISDKEYKITRGNEIKIMIDMKDGETITEFIQKVLDQ